MEPPQVIFLDAVGTLFGLRGSVGEIYADLAKEFGVQVDPDALNQAFIHSFKSSRPAAFPGVAPEEIPACEFAWWQAIAHQTFQQAGVLEQFADFSGFFVELYAHFATAAPWFVYPDVLLTLEYWQTQGIPLGVLSNFDSRLYEVLRILGLEAFFQSVTISTEVGTAKPHPQIFRTALQKHGCTAATAWHIGDSYQDDYQGAITAGLQGIWLKRPAPLIPLRETELQLTASSGNPPVVLRAIGSLRDLVQS